MNKTLLRELSYYVFYNLVTLVSITVIVSLITFFHFLLDHPIETIESWIFDSGWGLIIASKLIALFVVMKFFILNKNERPTFKQLVTDHFIFPKNEIFPILIVIITLFFVMERPQYIQGNKIELSKNISSFIYGLIFYFTDLFFLAQIGLNTNLKRGQSFLYPLIFVVTSKLSFLLVTATGDKGQVTTLITYLNMMLLMFLGSLNRENKFSFSAPLIFLFIYICPLISLFGLDHVWGDSHAILTFNFDQYFQHYFILSLLILCYLYLKKLKFKESYGIE